MLADPRQQLAVRAQQRALGADARVREDLARVRGRRGADAHRLPPERALAIEPRILVLDEPVSALDAPTRAGILRLLGELQASRGLAFVFITHDLRVARGLAHRLAVMYLGRFVEIGPARELLGRPTHPYTQALLSAIPSLDLSRREKPRVGLTGEVPDATALPAGCRFHPRCPWARDLCVQVEPELVERSTAHTSACHFAELMDAEPPGRP